MCTVCISVWMHCKMLVSRLLPCKVCNVMCAHCTKVCSALQLHCKMCWRVAVSRLPPPPGLLRKNLHNSLSSSTPLYHLNKTMTIQTRCVLVGYSHHNKYNTLTGCGHSVLGVKNLVFQKSNDFIRGCLGTKGSSLIVKVFIP